MAVSWKLDQCQRAIGELRLAGVPWGPFTEQTIHRLRRVVGFDGWCVAVCDPMTGLPTAAVGQDSPLRSCQRRMWQLEYCAADDIGGAGVPVAGPRSVSVLSETTGGHLARSRRWDELLRPAGTGDELRASLTAGGMRWGTLALYRAGHESRFRPDDVKAVESVRATLADAARASWTAPRTAPPGEDPEPSTLIGALDGTLLGTTPGTYAWLGRMGGAHKGPGYTIVYALLARLAASVAAAAGDDSDNAPDRLGANAVTRTADGMWAELHAAPLVGFDGRCATQRAAVTVRSASAPRIRGILLHAYEISDRERQVAALSADGLAAKDIAGMLHISPHTARDHLKAVFRKTHSHTRQELAARLSGC